MTILVTGGGGFVGGALVRALRGRGEDVRVLARGDYPQLRAQGVELVRADLRDEGAVSRACEGISLVFHVAAKVGYHGDPAEYEAINVQGTRHVIDGCRRHEVPSLVFTSTPSVVHSRRGSAGIDEGAPFPEQHVADYPRTKAEAERLVREANGDGLCTIALRPRGVWGPGDTQLVPMLVRWARQGRLRRIGRDDPLQDFTYIENVVDAHLLAAEALASKPGDVGGKAYFITNDEPRGVWTMAGDVLACADLELPPRPVPLGLARTLGAVIEWVHHTFGLRSEPRLTRMKVDVLTLPCWFDIGAAKRDLGYRPRVSTAEGLEELRAWIASGAFEDVV